MFRFDEKILFPKARIEANTKLIIEYKSYSFSILKRFLRKIITFTFNY
jgi:hypothetical protein